MEKKVLIMIKSAPFTNLNYYEALRTAAGLWDHDVKVLWMGKGVYGAISNVDQTLTKKFLSDLPDLDIELYVDEEALVKAGFNADELVDSVELADGDKITELILGAEATLIY
ncbi:DsrE family protein [Candidatus Bathyarchaeota archaeon]|nr:DsrE family protein [Candidatus Bathyarchaeota archaeon]